MKRRWSKIIKSNDEDVAVETIQMVELSRPFLSGLRNQENGGDYRTEETETLHDCSLLQQEAYEAGRVVGIEEGQGQLRAEVEAERQQISELMTQVGVAKVAAIQGAEEDILTIALGIAKKVIHREATVDQEIIANQIRQALTFLPTQVGVRIRAHPDEVAHLVNVCSTLMNRPDQACPVQIEGDQMIQRGGCLLETDTVFIDATIDRQLEVIRARLAEDDQQNEIDQSSSSS